jgi:hypothetical protein
MPSPLQYWSVVTALVSFSLVGGYFAGIQPIGEWRYFSWHPFLMTCGMIGLTGIAAMTKKLGGYANTKVGKKHALVTLWNTHSLEYIYIYICVCCVCCS